MTQYLFVYGTLRPGLAPPAVAHIIQQLRRVGAGSVRGRLYNLGAYPGALPDPAAETTIAGEVFEIPNDLAFWSALDDYEGFDPGSPGASLFVRTRCRVTLAGGRELESWIYAYNRHPKAAPLVVGGDYYRLQEINQKKE
ncbi:MAG TPA: gamma-glutamylcyclotransferase family protein [Blastocatellia bacterium]|jgi:gamma-glutamylcyclotransferase (GGCT)/AIG2-like uncharacterized protein YtfP|nr:gamma-glutamylcyclotransferase family protein [Blastocatellia bacterium]